MTIERLEERASELALHSRINYAYRRMQEYLHSRHTWGARHAGVLWARPVAYFSAEFGLHESLPIYSGGLGILAGDHIKSASDLGIPLVGVGLYYDQGYFRQRLDRDGWQHEEYIDARSPAPADPSRTRRRHAGGRLDRHAGGHDHGPRLEAVGRPQHAAAPRFERRRQPAGRSSAHVPSLRRGPARSHSPGAAARRRRHAGVGRDGHRPGRPASERRPQRLCGAGTGPAADGGRRHRRLGGAATRGRAGRVHDAHARPRRSRPFPRVPDRRAPWSAPRRARPLPPRPHEPRSRRPARRRRGILHDRAGAQGEPSRQRRLVPSRPCLAGDVDAALSRVAAKSDVPIGHITNGVHVQTWLAPQMRQVYDRHLGSDWPQRAGDAGRLGRGRGD